MDPTTLRSAVATALEKPTQIGRVLEATIRFTLQELDRLEYDDMFGYAQEELRRLHPNNRTHVISVLPKGNDNGEETHLSIEYAMIE